MTKKYFLMLFASILVAMAGVSLTACGGDDLEDTVNVSEKDPQGTVVVNMIAAKSYRDATQVRFVVTADNYWDAYMDDALNFYDDDGYIEFVSVGPVSGLSKVTTIPATGWSRKVAVVPGNGYVARVGYDQFYNEVTNRWEYRSYHYGRIYVVEYLTSGGAMAGATVKYQSSFTPTNK
jgi:sulfatase maturation enzyme AslB (radical SAM superfamily)